AMIKLFNSKLDAQRIHCVTLFCLANFVGFTALHLAVPKYCLGVARWPSRYPAKITLLNYFVMN
ncbi:hypothetical protein, partial [Photorhabdus sp. RM71S]|uniref:hypothetical protein n=1 Tax=Photorhabdus sp. RM71S TaxID=3342824 RepID=UPI0036DD3790